MPQTYNPQLGAGASRLMSMFMQGPSLRANANAQAGKAYASEAESLAQARKAELEGQQLQYAQGATWQGIAQAIGVTPQEITDFESGRPVAPLTQAKIARAKITNEFAHRGGGNAEALAKALQTNQQTGFSDAVLGGGLPAGDVAEAQAAAGGKDIFSQESGQILNKFRGTTQQTPLSRAHINKLNEEGGGAAGTLENSYDTIMGKGSWKKLTPQSQTFVYEESKSGTPMAQIVSKLRNELDNPQASVSKNDEEIVAARHYIASNPPKIPNPAKPGQLMDNPVTLSDLHYYDVLRKATQKLRGRPDPEYDKWAGQRQGTATTGTPPTNSGGIKFLGFEGS